MDDTRDFTPALSMPVKQVQNIELAAFLFCGILLRYLNCSVGWSTSHEFDSPLYLQGEKPRSVALEKLCSPSVDPERGTDKPLLRTL